MSIPSQTIYRLGDFSYLGDAHEISMTKNAYDAVSQTELWDWLKTFNPNEDGGFMFSNHPNIMHIGKKMEELPNPPGHSGASFALVMRRMQYIAAHGEEALCREIISARSRTSG